MGRRKYTKEYLEEKVKECNSISSLLRKCEVRVNGGNHRHIAGLLKEYNIDISHFLGASWSRGRTIETCEIIRNKTNKVRKSNDEVFRINSKVTQHTLRKRYLEKIFEKKCYNCGIVNWLDKPITLHLDHINGSHTDNRFENLRLLCPNCHQQTSTWGKATFVGELVESEDTTRLGRVTSNGVGVRLPRSLPICIDCGNKVRNSKAKRCWSCFLKRKESTKYEKPKRNYKIDWPTNEELAKMVWEKSTAQLAKEFGVSDKAIEKRCKVNNIQKPPRGYWMKQKAKF